ncbi:unnamed protein product, partial [Sphenostylis stenocarpa]
HTRVLRSRAALMSLPTCLRLCSTYNGHIVDEIMTHGICYKGHILVIVRNDTFYK